MQFQSTNYQSPPPLLSAAGISRVFGKGRAATLALPHISLHVCSGEFLSITGPSGSGKSTLLHLLSGLDRPSSGEVCFQNESFSGMKDSEIADIRNRCFGFIFQLPHLLQEKTVLENVALPFRYGRVAVYEKCPSRCMEVLSSVGLDQLAGRYPASLSGGEMQRLAFARAMVRDPQVIFADEPTGSLDGENSTRLVALLREQVEQGKTVVMVSHDPLVKEFSSRNIPLGKVISQKKSS